MNYSTTGEQGYLDLIRDILDNGVDRDDRTGTGTRSVFGRQLRFDLSEGFPLLTTKKMELKSVLSELIWFIEGSGDERRLAEIRYGKPRDKLNGKTTIWTANAEADYWATKAAFEGDLGRVYGVQWRAWTNRKGEQTDQIANLVRGLQEDPNSRRHILLGWNPGELDEMALPPCHVMSNFYVVDGKLSCMMTQRSQDVLLGAPYNYASYALLTHMLAQVCGYGVGELIVSSADTHLYLNHLDQAREQIARTPRELPQLIVKPDVTSIELFTMADFKLEGYDPHPAIKAPMAV